MRVTVRKLQQPRGWAWTLAVLVAKPLLLMVVRRRWIDGERIPATGGCVVVGNHLSHVDPFTTALFVYDHGRLPRYLAKSGVFRIRLVAFFLRAAGQIPVERMTASAAGAYDAAVAAVHSGECLVVYPEGTLTRDPGLWPMRGKTGAARIALETGCPVIPIGQWGPQALLAPYARLPHPIPRKLVTIKAGAPVDLSDLAAQPHTPEVVHAATERIMDAVTALVAELRGETPPAQRFDPVAAGLPEIGNPHRNRRSA